MSMNQSVLICDQVAPILNEILLKNGLKITYEPEITPDQIKEKISNFDIVVVRSRTKITRTWQNILSQRRFEIIIIT